MILRKYVVDWRGFANRWIFYGRYFTLYGATMAATKLAVKEGHTHNWKVSKVNSNGDKETKLVIHRNARREANES